MTCFGDASFARPYRRCPSCGVSSTADEEWGLEGRQSPRLCRMLTLLSTMKAFRPASSALAELLGVRLGAETLRRQAHRDGARAERWLAAGDDVADAAFAEAAGDAELAVDAVKVNTLDGFRDLKMEVWQKRPSGTPVDASAAWKKRRLPPPTARRVRVGIVEAKAFASDWPERAATLGAAPDRLTLLGDGADWIWNARHQRLPDADGVLDVFHASQKLHEAGAALFGDQTPAARAWGEAATDTLVRDGWDGLVGVFDDALATHQGKRKQTALHGARAYFFTRRRELGYRRRLAEGKSIGSGAVEGEAKQQGRRLKIGGRWRPENAVRMGSLLAIDHAGLRETFYAAA